MQTDETRISVVHKSGEVVAEMEHHKAYAAERGKTRTTLTCSSASGCVLPLMMTILLLLLYFLVKDHLL